MIGRLALAFIAGPVLLVLIAAIIEYPVVLLIPVGLSGLAFAYGVIAEIAKRPAVPDPNRQPLPPQSLSPPQPLIRRAPSALDRPPTTVPGEGSHSPGYGNLLRFGALRRLPANWRYRSPRMRPPADGSPPA